MSICHVFYFWHIVHVDLYNLRDEAAGRAPPPPQARIQKFLSEGGPNLPKKFDDQKKKPVRKKDGSGVETGMYNRDLISR